MLTVHLIFGDKVHMISVDTVKVQRQTGTLLVLVGE